MTFSDSPLPAVKHHGSRHRLLGLLLLVGCSDSIDPGRAPAEIRLGPARTIILDDTARIAAVVYDHRGSAVTGARVTWRSLSPGIATVTDQGEIAAISLGSTIVQATVGSVTADLQIDVAPYFTHLALGLSHTCGITGDGRALCAGLNFAGQLGRVTSSCPDLGTSCGSTLGPVVADHLFVDLAAGERHTCGLTSDGVAWCWGANHSFELGAQIVGTTTSAPTLVTGSLRFEKLAAGARHTCGLTADRDAYCWGEDDWAQLGAGTVAPDTCVNYFGSTVPCSRSPKKVTGGHKFAELGAGAAATCGLTAERRVYCWGMFVGGNDPEACQGGGRTECTRTPLLQADEAFTHLAVGGDARCGRTDGGTLLCWGFGIEGTFGDGTETFLSLTPRIGGGGMPFSSVVAGAAHMCALDDSGAAYCWGHDAFGETGASTVSPKRLSPVAVTGSLTFDWIVSNGPAWTTCGVTSDGRAYCWGDGRFAQRGDGVLLQLVTGPQRMRIPRSEQ